MSSTLERWREYEIETWDENRIPENSQPLGFPWKYWDPITDEGGYVRFIDQAQSWVTRCTSANEHQIALLMAENPDQIWVNPRAHQPNLVWRGQTCAGWKLASTAQRHSNQKYFNSDLSALSTSDLAKEWEAAEDAVIAAEDGLLSRVQSGFNRGNFSDIENLAWAQHEGSGRDRPELWATRLLDVSRDPWVALYFATEECPDHPHDECNGRVAVFDDILLRPVTDGESASKIRSEIGAIWNPSDQHENMKAQKGSFLISGLLPTSYRGVLQRWITSEPTAPQSGRVGVGGLSLTTANADVIIMSRLAIRLQDICVPGIKPAFFGSVTAFMKNQNQDFPPIVTQSIQIVGSAKPLFRRLLKENGITHRSLFPSLYMR